MDSITIERAHKLVSLRNQYIPLDKPTDFIKLAEAVRNVYRELTPLEKDSMPWLAAWAIEFRKLYDDFEEIRKKDPGILYKPQHKTSADFHKSRAFVRYYQAGNRTGKTQAAMQEHYWVTTDQHPYLNYGSMPRSTFIVGVDYTKYAISVFEKKFISGEDGNPLSPYFPEGGKWLHKYDSRAHTIYIACKQCAEKYRAEDCRHRKSTIRLFSDNGGWEVLQGAVYTLAHIDEHVSEDFFTEGLQRLMTTRPYSKFMITGTPLIGPDQWEIQRVQKVWEVGGKDNLTDEADPKSPPYAELFRVSQYEAGLTPHNEIAKQEKLMTSAEAKARIYGQPMPLAKNPVFDWFIVDALQKTVDKGERMSLRFREEDITTLKPHSQAVVEPDPTAALVVYEKPQENVQYIIGVDTAQGLSGGTHRLGREPDYSVATVLKLTLSENGGFNLYQSAELAINSLDPSKFADEVMKLAIWYNGALLAVENTGLGMATVMRLKDNGYWNIYREKNNMIGIDNTSNPTLGISTNVATKPFMVSSLKNFLHAGALKVNSVPALMEMVSFEEVRQSKQGNELKQFKLQAAGGAKDDRVMALAMAAGVVVSRQSYYLSFLMPKTTPKLKKDDYHVL